MVSKKTCAKGGAMTTATSMQTDTQAFSMRLLQQDRVPDWLIRSRIRKLLQERLAAEDKGDPEMQQQHLMQLIAELKSSPIAIDVRDANEQHYELPTEFFQAVLGKHLKYCPATTSRPPIRSTSPRSACWR